jgi:hypothetical protein
MAIIIRSFKSDNAGDIPFVKANTEPKQLLATIQSNVGSRLVYQADMVCKDNGVAFMVLVDTNTDDMTEYANRIGIVKKVTTFLEKTFG